MLGFMVPSFRGKLGRLTEAYRVEEDFVLVLTLTPGLNPST